MSANDGQISAKCRATLIMRHFHDGEMRVSAFGSAGLFVDGGQLRFVHVPIRTRAGAVRSSPARAAWVLSPVARFWVWASAPGVPEKRARALYRGIYTYPTHLREALQNR